MPPAWKERLYSEVNVTEGDDEELVKWKLRLAGAPPSRPPPRDQDASDHPSSQGGTGPAGKPPKGLNKPPGGSTAGGDAPQQGAAGGRAGGGKKPPPPPPPPPRRPGGGEGGARPPPPSAPQGSSAAFAAGAKGQGGKGSSGRGGADPAQAAPGDAVGGGGGGAVVGWGGGKAALSAAEVLADRRAAMAAAAAGGAGGGGAGAGGSGAGTGQQAGDGRTAARSGAAEASRLFQNKSRSVALFQESNFNPDAFITSYLSGLSAKAVEGAAHELNSLNEYCNQEILSSVHKHHKAFLEASLAIPQLDQAAAELRVCVQGAEAVAQALGKARALSMGKRGGSSGGGADPSTAAHPSGFRPLPMGGMSEEEEGQVQAVTGLVADLEVAVAEQDVAAATTILRAGRMMVQVLERDQAIIQQPPTATGMALRDQLEATLEAKRLALVLLLQAQLAVSSSSTAEVRTAASHLAVLAGDCTAATALLSCHSLKLQDMAQALLKYYSAAGEEDNLQYAGSLAQKTFLQVGRAVDDLVAVFGDGCREVYALLLQWAMREAHTLSRSVVQNALVPLSSSSEDLQDVSHCVAMVLSCCLVLELDHGLSLVDEVQPELWGHLEGVLRKRLTRQVAELYTQAAEDARKLLADHAFQGQMSSMMWRHDFGDDQLPSTSTSGAAGGAKPGGALSGQGGRDAGSAGGAHTSRAAALAASRQLLAEVQTLARVLLPLASLAGPAIGALLAPWLTEATVALCAGCNAGLERGVASDGSTSGAGPNPAVGWGGAAGGVGAAAAAQLPDLIHDLREGILDMLEDVESSLRPLAMAALGAASFQTAPERLQQLVGQLGQRALDQAAAAPVSAAARQQQQLRQQLQQQLQQQVDGAMLVGGDQNLQAQPNPSKPTVTAGESTAVGSDSQEDPGQVSRGRPPKQANLGLNGRPGSARGRGKMGTQEEEGEEEEEGAEGDVRLPGPPSLVPGRGGIPPAGGPGSRAGARAVQRPNRAGGSSDEESVGGSVGPSAGAAAGAAGAAGARAGAAELGNGRPGQRSARGGLVGRRGLVSLDASSDEGEGGAVGSAVGRGGRRTAASVPSTTPRLTTPLGSDSSEDDARVPAWQARRMALRAQRAGGAGATASRAGTGGGIATAAGAPVATPLLSSRTSASSVAKSAATATTATTATASRPGAATPAAAAGAASDQPQSTAATGVRPRSNLPPPAPVVPNSIRRPVASSGDDSGSEADGPTTRPVPGGSGAGAAGPEPGSTPPAGAVAAGTGARAPMLGEVGRAESRVSAALARAAAARARRAAVTKSSNDDNDDDDSSGSGDGPTGPAPATPAAVSAALPRRGLGASFGRGGGVGAAAGGGAASAGPPPPPAPPLTATTAPPIRARAPSPAPVTASSGVTTSAGAPESSLRQQAGAAAAASAGRLATTAAARPAYVRRTPRPQLSDSD